MDGKDTVLFAFQQFFKDYFSKFHKNQIVDF